jgi:lipopolysaccharide export system protein LptC
MLARPTDTPDASTRLGPRPSRALTERSAVFNNAARHSQKVRALKVALPVLAATMAVLFLYQSFFSTPAPAEIIAQDSAVAEGKLVMANPKLQGYTSDDRPYSVSAQRAVQDITNEAVIDLQGISATLPISEKASARIDTERGEFDRMMNTLVIDNAITISTTDGASARLASARVDLAEGRMTTDRPVEIHANGATITADGMSVEENGKRVVFEKRVRVHIVLPQAETASQ